MKSRRDARVENLRRQAAAAGWTRDRLVEEIHRAAGVSLLLAHRLASGRTQAETAERLREIHTELHGEPSRLSHQQVSKWENGSDRPEKYLDALCRLYETRPDRLGLGRDYGQADAAEDSVLPRRLLLSLPVGVAASHGLAELESMRLRLNGLTHKPSAQDRTIEHWEQEIQHYGVQIRFMDPIAFLIQATNAMKAVCDMFESRPSWEIQKRLGESIARLAGLIALDCNASGNVDNMHNWFHLAQTFADECGDRTLRAWALAYEAMSYLWHGKNLNRALDLAERAGAMAPRESTSAPLAASIEARALARLGRGKEALARIELAEAQWSRLEPRLAGDESTFGFYEHLLRMYQSDVLTVLGVEFARAYEVQDRAVGLAAAKTGDIDTALVRLDRAICLAKQKELAESCRVVAETIKAVPDGFKSGTAAQKARSVVGLVADGGGARMAGDLREALRC